MKSGRGSVLIVIVERAFTYAVGRCLENGCTAIGASVFEIGYAMRAE